MGLWRTKSHAFVERAEALERGRVGLFAASTAQEEDRRAEDGADDEPLRAVPLYEVRAEDREEHEHAAA